MCRSLLLLSAALLGLCRLIPAQDVVSASSGLLQYFEGTVILDDKTIEHKAAVFPSLSNGSTLRTEKGKAELVLTPGVYLRLDDKSSVLMVSNSLIKTRLDVAGGSAILDNLNAPTADAIVLGYEGSEIRFPKPGIYRIDSDVGELQVYSGECKVTRNKVSTTVDSSHLYYFALQMTTQKFGDGATDEFYDWASNRNSVMADQNQLASAGQDDVDGGLAGLGSPYVVPPTYLSPNFGLSATPSVGYSTYGSTSPFTVYQPTPYSSFAPAIGLFVLAPYRNRPAGSHWPITTMPGYHPPVGYHPGAGYHPPAVITRWPSPSVNGLSHVPTISSGYHQPIARPPVTSGARPSAIYSAPHVGAHVGHR